LHREERLRGDDDDGEEEEGWWWWWWRWWWWEEEEEVEEEVGGRPKSPISIRPLRPLKAWMRGQERRSTCVVLFGDLYIYMCVLVWGAWGGV
jgi:hypothetical protein